MTEVQIEVVQQHELQDIYRLQPGVLVVVHKYAQEPLAYANHRATPFIGNIKKQKGISRCYQTLVALQDGGVLIPEGSLILGDRVVRPLSDPREYWCSLKLKGGHATGSADDLRDLAARVRGILSKYKG